MDNIIYDMLKKYFDRLSKVGYLNYNDVYKMIVYIFLNNLLSNDLSKYSSEKDIKKIIDVLHCLGLKNCVIPKYIYSDNLFDEIESYSSITSICPSI